ncbi:insulinase family protein [Algoriphagus sp. H41]|uniref:Insulinase family protein n=1 Tax=Algoriphagus oliviformis TaxID=2811231 RepID=A0ABS3C4V0_9BACT|nr:pitrilysin family protein [Algoriphagus oliviformis]MBN7811631.1 insulinase family protein [Algoriphagus oliviformis]
MPLDRSKAPEFVVPADFELPAPHILALSGGRRLYFIPTPGLDVVKLEVLGKSQRLSLPLEKSLVPSFTLQMLTEGTQAFSEAELSEFFDFHATEVHPLITYSHEGMSLLTTKKHFGEVMPVFASLFEQASFPDESLEKRKIQRKLSIKFEREKSSSRASSLFRKALFGENHPYGQEITEAHVDQVDRSDLLAYYQDRLWTGTEFFLCGNLDEAELAQTAALLDTFPLQPSTDSIDLPPAVGSPMILEDRADALQSSIRMGGWSIPKSHPDFLALSVFNTILGGYFGSRLIKNIREDKGHTYGISSSLAEIGDLNYWVIGADVQKSQRDLVVGEIYKEIQQLATESVHPDELEVVRNYLIGQMLSRFSSSFDLMDRFRAVHHSGLDFEFYRQKMDFLRDFTAEDILRVGQKYFSQPPYTEVLVG